MRIKNKEIRRRRHRKEQVMKAADRETRALYSGKGTATGAAAEKPAAKAKAAPKKTETVAKPKKTPAKKKSEEAAAE